MIMLKNIYQFLFALLLFIVLDLIWFKMISGSFFLDRMRDMVEVENNSMVIQYESALAVYILLAFGIINLVKPTSFEKLLPALLKGALYGFICYGIYDFTNHATLKGWSLDLMLVDISWGAFSCATVSASSFLVFNKLYR